MHEKHLLNSEKNKLSIVLSMEKKEKPRRKVSWNISENLSEQNDDWRSFELWYPDFCGPLIGIKCLNRKRLMNQADSFEVSIFLKREA